MQGITGIIGPEGSGKTTLMTAYCCGAARYGGKVYTFPGYEVIDRKEKPVSETILPEQWASLPENINGVVIAITEANIFFNSLHFQESTSELFTYLGQQRRKRKLGIIYDVQLWNWFNNRLRDLTHVLVSCWDLYWTYRYKKDCPPRGTNLIITERDCKGFYTGRPWSKARPKLFNGSRYWPFFRTDDTVDPMAGKVKINYKKRQVMMSDGAVMGSQGAYSVDEQKMKQSFSGYQIPDVEYVLRQITDKARSMKIEMMPVDEVRGLVETSGLKIPANVLGRHLKNMGVEYVDRRSGNYYRFT